MPMRAHIICTAAISGHVRKAVQIRLVPNCAPAIEYVAMPEGSSSAAPVMRPGPRLPQNLFRTFGLWWAAMKSELFLCYSYAVNDQTGAPGAHPALRVPDSRGHLSAFEPSGTERF